MHLDLNNNFRMDIDAFGMILTLIFVTNTYILIYPNHPKQAWGPVGMRGSWVGRRNTVIYAKNKVPESQFLICVRTMH